MNTKVAEAVKIRRYRRGKSRSDEGSQHMPLRQGKLPMVFIFIKKEGKDDEDTFIYLYCALQTRWRMFCCPRSPITWNQRERAGLVPVWIEDALSVIERQAFISTIGDLIVRIKLDHTWLLYI